MKCRLHETIYKDIDIYTEQTTPAPFFFGCFIYNLQFYKHFELRFNFLIFIDNPIKPDLAINTSQ